MNATTTLIAWLVLAAPPSDESFRSNVRPTEPLTPAEQAATFHLPPGFEIQLFASEPDIQKPMNLAVDAAGRLWMSGSVEYPYAAEEGNGHDAIKILEDTNGDGRADKITTFADGLNIPIGLFPYRDGVVAYSIPNIWFLRDTNGDGQADTREILYGPLGVPRDTHGMQNAFRRGFDGWLYVNHGFANDTTIRGRDGSMVRLQSGNTYRVRLDGSRVEQFTWGQVNPFGATILPDGDQVTADCHSKPLTLLLRGAYYSSFGKPHDGLGFAPDLMDHDHGSTAICGVTQLAGDHLPAEFRGRLLVGNVMTSRVNQDTLRYTGSSPRAVEQQDFLTCDDPWFRPVDLQLGPDGAVYVADFYNRIIGHYEVPLEHPARDKHRARIWRITYRGSEAKVGPASPSLQRADADALIGALASPIPSRRMLATDQLSDRVGEAAVPQLIAAASSNSSPTTRVHSLWALFRLQKLPDETLLSAAKDSDELVRMHAQRLLSETSRNSERLVSAVKGGLLDTSPLVRRAAADAAGRQEAGLVAELITALEKAPADDPTLRYTMRMALREQLRRADAWSFVAKSEWTAEQRGLLADVALAVSSPEAAQYLLAELETRPTAGENMEAQLSHLAVHLPANRLPDIVALFSDRLRLDDDQQAKLLTILNQRLAQRGEQSSVVKQWGRELAKRLLDPDRRDTMWANLDGENPWGLEPRRCADGQNAMFLSSLPGGEQRTSVLRSREFVIPPQLSFYLCGHLGFPDRPATNKNFVQLRLTEEDEVVAQAFPPRNDTAQRIVWDLSKHAGQRGYLEIVDQLDLAAYAWLAVARFEPPVVRVPEIAPLAIADRQVAASGLIAALRLIDLHEPLLRIVGDRQTNWRARQAAAQACLAEQDRPLLTAMSHIIASTNVVPALRGEVAAAVALENGHSDESLLVRTMQSIPAREQRQVADALAATAAGSEALLKLVEQGHAAARLLQDRAILQKLAVHPIAELPARVTRLTASLPTANTELQQLIDERRRTFAGTKTDPQRGNELFIRHCAACHQVRGKGSLVGPQLDGIGNRGVDRVLEDVLDPNRNVDATFHVSVLTLTDGRVVTGLVRREEGENVILVDQQGKEFTVRRGDIDERSLTKNSLMPANVPELLKPNELLDLIGFLLTLQAAPGPAKP